MSFSSNDINGEQAGINVDRAIGELRRGCAVCVVADERSGLFVSAESGDAGVFVRLSGHGTPLVLITAQRARILGFSPGSGEGVCAFKQNGVPDYLTARALALGGYERANNATAARDFESVPCPSGASAAVSVAKLARLLPSLFFVDREHRDSRELNGNVLSVNTSDVARYPQLRSRVLTRVSEAQIPLAGFKNCRFVMFRGADGATEHLAIVIGTLATGEPVPVRLHSSCLTGDLFGSLRCDCGDQLRGAVETIANLGGGVLLYLSQEGRGIGLASKLRAYTLQDGGLDTIDADAHLGYESDERDYGAASEMLRSLGISRVRLLTNNPSKVNALNESSITVEERIPVLADSNPHNIRYLRSKLERAGHLLYLENVKG